jgi:hypothetical protein
LGGIGGVSHTGYRWFRDATLPVPPSGWADSFGQDHRGIAGRILSDPDVRVIVVGHRHGLARFGVEHLQAAWSAQSRRIVAAGIGESIDDLVRDMIEVLTSTCARPYGRRRARNRAMRALSATKRDRWEAA